MKKAIKWIFIIICVAILAIDFAGFWKYKLKGTKYEIATTAAPQEDAATEEIVEPEIEYTQLNSKNFSNGEKLFITNINLDENDNTKYIVQGCIYEEYEITKKEYDNIKSGKSTIKIFNSEYSKDKIQSNNLKLKSSDNEAESLYIKYDSKTKKYILKESTTDYIVYKQTEKYVQTSIDGNVGFVIEKNGKKNQSTVKKEAESHNNIEIPEDTIKINLSSLTFDKKGKCTKITKTEISE